MPRIWWQLQICGVSHCPSVTQSSCRQFMWWNVFQYNWSGAWELAAELELMSAFLVGAGLQLAAVFKIIKQLLSKVQANLALGKEDK